MLENKYLFVFFIICKWSICWSHVSKLKQILNAQNRNDLVKIEILLHKSVTILFAKAFVYFNQVRLFYNRELLVIIAFP